MALKATDKYFAIGLMSGTSLDGIDAALIETDGKEYIDFIGSTYMKYDADMQRTREIQMQRENSMRGPHVEILRQVRYLPVMACERQRALDMPAARKRLRDSGVNPILGITASAHRARPSAVGRAALAARHRRSVQNPELGSSNTRSQGALAQRYEERIQRQRGGRQPTSVACLPEPGDPWAGTGQLAGTMMDERQYRARQAYLDQFDEAWARQFSNQA